MAVVGSFLKEVRFVHMDTPNEAIAPGWAICNGQTLNSSQQDINPGSNYTMPNLINRYILGADPANSAGSPGNISGTAPGPNAVGGSHSVTLSSTQMPRHFHSFKWQPLTLSDVWTESTPPPYSSYQMTPRDDYIWSDTVGSQGNFIGWEGGNLDHTNPGSSGGGTAPFDNRPAFGSLVPIMRVKL